jgi:hypothetical protein
MNGQNGLRGGPRVVLGLVIISIDNIGHTGKWFGVNLVYCHHPPQGK